MPKQNLETASEACLRLNVSAQTLYAYVSRGLVRTKPHFSDSRKRLYLSTDIDQLVHRQTKARSRQAVARSTIDFGEPVLQSKISNIHQGQFYYRGQNAVDLSRTATLEDVFELLCETKVSDSNSSHRMSYLSQHTTPFKRFVDALAQHVTSDSAYGNRHHAYRLLRLMACNAAQQNTISANEPVHEQLARAWSSDSRAGDLIRRALVLSADHELNASTYATRVTASAGAKLSACLLTGVSTLSGNHHGGLTDLCVNWMRDAAVKRLGQIEISRHKPPPGFGHRLYPNGDPRAVEILEHCPSPKSWSRVARSIIKRTASHPTLDFGLATLEHQLKLPKGSGFSIFAVGRTAGWLAHCFEQRKSGNLIRPRASNL